MLKPRSVIATLVTASFVSTSFVGTATANTDSLQIAPAEFPAASLQNDEEPSPQHLEQPDFVTEVTLESAEVDDQTIRLTAKTDALVAPVNDVIEIVDLEDNSIIE